MGRGSKIAYILPPNQAFPNFQSQHVSVSWMQFPQPFQEQLKDFRAGLEQATCHGFTAEKKIQEHPGTGFGVFF